MASIREIAKMTGVSVSTVSRVLNNPQHKCASPDLRERIWKAAMQLHYVPNKAARQLKCGDAQKKEKIWSIHVLMTRMDKASADPFFSELLRVVESEIHKKGCILSKVWYRSIFSDDKRCQYENVDGVIKKMAAESEHAGDGLIVIGKCNQTAIKKLHRHYKAIVCVNRDSSKGEADEVICNGGEIARMSVEYLISLGHERIGYVGGCQNEARYRGYLETLKAHGIDPDPDCIVHTKLSEMEGFQAMEHFLHSDKAPTGIYCANDITAVGMLKYLAKNKSWYYHPSIIASDGIEEAQNTSPMLTTVEIPKEEMGRFALYLLVDRLAGGHKGVTRMELQAKLVKRESCQPAGESFVCEYYI